MIMDSVLVRYVEQPVLKGTKTIQESIRSLILNPDYAEYLAVLKAARNGAVYGAKIRAPHALV